jgi:predicted metalloprotease with PDZ domain
MPRYRLTFSEPHAHLVDVEARFAEVTGPEAVLRMAAWTPGSYLVRDYARHVQDVSAEDEDGRPLRIDKVEKAAWRVVLDGARDLVVRYRVYAWELTVRTSHVDATHAFLNGAPTFLWLEEQRAEPHEVVVEPRPGWRVVSGLGDGAQPLVAHDLDELIDSPIHAGAGPVLELEAAGRPHVVALWGRPDVGAADLEQLVADTRRIIEHQAGIFGGLPYERYAFLLMLAAGARGGLEHRASTALLAAPTAFATRKKYEDLLELVAHEFFHLWNVKRIRPRPLGPFDYGREAYTRALWVVEGLTSYFDRYTLRRTKLLSTKRYLEKLADEWGQLLAVPGRARQSVEESSFDAWIKLYRPDENSLNSTVSYYLKGSLVCLCLDLEIRRRTAGRHALDDALRHLWREYGEAGRGYGDEDIGHEIERAVGLDLGEFFARFVRGREDPDLAGELAACGLTLRPKPQLPDDEERGGAWLGANVRTEGGRLVVAAVPSGSPAERGGVYAGDEIVAIDGLRVDEKGLNERLAARRPGVEAQLTLFRREVEQHVAVTLVAKPVVWEIVATEGASDESKQLGRSWLGED